MEPVRTAVNRTSLERMTSLTFHTLPDSVVEIAFVILLMVVAALIFGIQYWQHRNMRYFATEAFSSRSWMTG